MLPKLWKRCFRPVLGGEVGGCCNVSTDSYKEGSGNAASCLLGEGDRRDIIDHPEVPNVFVSLQWLFHTSPQTDINTGSNHNDSWKLYTLCIRTQLGIYGQLYPFLRLWEFPLALPFVTASEKGLYLTVYPLSRPNMDTVNQLKQVVSARPGWCHWAVKIPWGATQGKLYYTVKRICWYKSSVQLWNLWGMLVTPNLSTIYYFSHIFPALLPQAL